MDMRPNIPASQSPSAPSTEREPQPMCLTDIDERFRNMENQFYLFSTALKAQGKTIDELSKQINFLLQQNEEKDQEIANLHSQCGEDTTNGDKLVFDFTHHKKKDIYAWLIDGLRLGIIKGSMSDLIRWLAHFTNLGSEASIRSQLYGYK